MHPVYGAGAEFTYERKNGQTPNYPNGFNEWGKAWAVADRHGVTLYREGERDCASTASSNNKGKGKGTGYGSTKDDKNTVYSATKYICHPDGTWSYHTYDNMGESHHGEFRYDANMSNQVGIGKVTRYGDGNLNVVTTHTSDKNCVTEQEAINGSMLAQTTYTAKRSFDACDQRANEAIDRHNDDRCGNTFNNLWVWVICIIIIIIIIVIIVWAVRGGRRDYGHPGSQTVVTSP